MRWKTFWQDESGPTATEYAVMLALIIFALVATIQGVAEICRSAFTAAAEPITLASTN
jgi:Flp pilus assembly pilin Flp